MFYICLLIGEVFQPWHFDTPGFLYKGPPGPPRIDTGDRKPDWSSVIIEGPQGPQIAKNVDFELQLRRISLFGSYYSSLVVKCANICFMGTCLWSAYWGNCWTMFLLRGIQQLHNRCSCVPCVLIDLLTTLRWGHKLINFALENHCHLVLSTFCGQPNGETDGPLFYYLESSNPGIDSVVPVFFTLTCWWPHSDVHII